MSAEVESMFFTREKPWHGLGTMVAEAPTSKVALQLAELDWKVFQRGIETEDGISIPGYKANIRDKDSKVLGVVTERYQVVQNEEAFSFTDALLGEGVTYETAGSLQGGRRIWLLAKIPMNYQILGDVIEPYLVFMNAHDGSGAIKVAATPIRVVCQNTLNLALAEARRCWSANHTGKIFNKMEEAQNTLMLAGAYMSELQHVAELLQKMKLSERKVLEYIDALFPLLEELSPLQKKNLMKLKTDMKMRYFDAPDLQDFGHTGYRFISAVTDFATHNKPLRETVNFKENLFSRTVEGNVMIDKAYEIVSGVI